VKAAKAISEKHDWKVVLYHGETTGIIPHGSLGDLIVGTLQTKERQVVG
jgi:hypothetical protein